jgi:NTE family protein
MNAANTRKKVGLALSGGAARGLAHIGVLEAIVKAGIPIDLIAGTSAGGIVGAAYAWNLDIEKVKEFALNAVKKMAPLIDPSFPKTGFLKGKKVMHLLSNYVGENTTFSDLKIPFACTATDIDTGEEIIIDSGSVTEALRATISLPGIFTIVKREGRYLVDGGLTTPVPVHVAKDMGAEFIIAVNVNPDVAGRMGKTGKERVESRKEPNIFQVMVQSIYITTYSLARTSLAAADVAIEPDLGNIKAGDFHHAKEMIEIGYEAGLKAIPEIREKLGAR